MSEPLSAEVMIFSAVLEVPSELREQFLAEACGADCGLRFQVEDLLRAHMEAGKFLESQMKSGARSRPVRTKSRSALAKV